MANSVAVQAVATGENGFIQLTQRDLSYGVTVLGQFEMAVWKYRCALAERDATWASAVSGLRELANKCGR